MFRDMALPGWQPIDEPQSPACQVAFDIPVYSETSQRLMRQLASLVRQQGDTERFEIIYVVNNGPDDGSVKWREAYERNRCVLDLPIFRNRSALHPAPVGFEYLCEQVRTRLAVYAVDFSSPGRWIEKCNCPLATQQAMVEASYRFMSRGVDGILCDLDADTYLEDDRYVDRVIQLFADRPRLIAVAGDFESELDPDDVDSQELARYLKPFQAYVLWARLGQILEDGEVPYRWNERFTGPHIVHRAEAGMTAGGYPNEYPCDHLFGYKLIELAEKRGEETAMGWQVGLSAVTAFRISTRTESSWAPEMRAVTSGPLPFTMADLQYRAEQVCELPQGREYLRFLAEHSPFYRTRLRGEA